MSPSGAAPRRGRSPRRRTKRQIPALTSQVMDGSPEGRVPLALPRAGAARRAGERNGSFQRSRRRRWKGVQRGESLWRCPAQGPPAAQANETAASSAHVAGERNGSFQRSRESALLVKSVKMMGWPAALAEWQRVPDCSSDIFLCACHSGWYIHSPGKIGCNG